MATVYANVVNVKCTPQELVFEFGSVFPETPVAPGTPIHFEPEVRVVLTISALPTLTGALQKAKEIVENAQHASMPQSVVSPTASKQ
jgi:hypothetical protein